MPTFIVAKVIKSVDVEGKFGPQKRIAFTTNETGEQILSVFSKYDLKPGQQIEGEVSAKEVNGKTYHNFNFKKGGGYSTPANNQLATTVGSLVIQVNKMREALYDKGIMERPVAKIAGTDLPYPESTGPTAFDDVPADAYSDADFS